MTTEPEPEVTGEPEREVTTPRSLESLTPSLSESKKDENFPVSGSVVVVTVVVVPDLSVTVEVVTTSPSLFVTGPVGSVTVGSTVVVGSGAMIPNVSIVPRTSTSAKDGVVVGGVYAGRPNVP